LALDKRPDDGHFRGTRGRILARMKRWQEALTDMEAALPAEGESSQLHQDLAETYSALAIPDLATQHRLRAEAIAARQKAKPVSQ
jgi:uncharacterized protein HemY